MQAPIRAFRFVHGGIRAELAGLEEAAAVQEAKWAYLERRVPGLTSPRGAA